MKRPKNMKTVRAIRITWYPPYWFNDHSCWSSVVRDSDIKITATEYVELMTDPKKRFFKSTASGKSIESFAVADIFEMSGGTTDQDFVAEASRRQEERESTERDLAIFFYHSARLLKNLSDTGTLKSRTPAPLSSDQLMYGMSLLARLPWYRHQTIICSSNIDGKLVEMTNGRARITGIIKRSKWN